MLRGETTYVAPSTAGSAPGSTMSEGGGRAVSIARTHCRDGSSSSNGSQYMFIITCRSGPGPEPLVVKANARASGSSQGGRAESGTVPGDLVTGIDERLPQHGLVAAERDQPGPEPQQAG